MIQYYVRHEVNSFGRQQKSKDYNLTSYIDEFNARQDRLEGKLNGRYFGLVLENFNLLFIDLTHALEAEVPTISNVTNLIDTAVNKKLDRMLFDEKFHSLDKQLKSLTNHYGNDHNHLSDLINQNQGNKLVLFFLSACLSF